MIIYNNFSLTALIFNEDLMQFKVNESMKDTKWQYHQKLRPSWALFFSMFLPSISLNNARVFFKSKSTTFSQLVQRQFCLLVASWSNCCFPTYLAVFVSFVKVLVLLGLGGFRIKYSFPKAPTDQQMQHKINLQDIEIWKKMKRLF